MYASSGKEREAPPKKKWYGKSFVRGPSAMHNNIPYHIDKKRGGGAFFKLLRRKYNADSGNNSGPRIPPPTVLCKELIGSHIFPLT